MFEQFFSSILDKMLSGFSARNIPFFVIVITLSVMGVFFSRKVWTKERAYRKWKWSKFFRVMRESQVLHPMLAGAMWLALWRDPMDYGWDAGDAFSFGLLAGALSLFPWVILKIYMKRHYNVDLASQLPGLSSEKMDDVVHKAEDLADAVDDARKERQDEAVPPAGEE